MRDKTNLMRSCYKAEKNQKIHYVRKIEAIGQLIGRSMPPKLLMAVQGNEDTYC